MLFEIIYIFGYRKQMKGILKDVHLNLSIALLLALVILIGGLETSKNIRVCVKCVEQSIIILL